MQSQNEKTQKSQFKTKSKATKGREKKEEKSLQKCKEKGGREKIRNGREKRQIKSQNKKTKQKDKTKSHRKILRKLDLREIPRTNQPRTFVQMNFRDCSVRTKKVFRHSLYSN